MIPFSLDRAASLPCFYSRHIRLSQVMYLYKKEFLDSNPLTVLVLMLEAVAYYVDLMQSPGATWSLGPSVVSLVTLMKA